MPDFRNLAKKIIDGGFSVIPVNSTKNPAIAKWGLFQVRPMNSSEIEKYFKDCYGIALLCGGKWRVVGLDFDLKYDLSGDLWDRFKAELPVAIGKKMRAQTTKNGGYHLIFKAPSTRMFGNEKLAARPTTPYERHQTYMAAFNDPETIDKATTIAHGDKSRILIETRSGTEDCAGGYVLIAPTEGYETLGGKIKELTEDEYDVVMELARSFNLVKGLEDKGKGHYFNEDWELHPYDHYNQEGDVLQLLYDNGWSSVGSDSGRNVRLRRPGQTHSKSSALFDKETRIFNCFSTSTEFDVTKGYNPVGVFSLLECDGDMGETYRELINLEYGIK
ncbi:MAG: bifunctional DNA primase/polymerase [Candidatus Riesia sp.]|nr:bifunctional DNA primase/polymerase [Candidatus Riesia sp.]